MLRIFILICFFTLCRSVDGKEYHVSVKGDDNDPGTERASFRTIGKAAEVAYLAKASYEYPDGSSIN